MSDETSASKSGIKDLLKDATPKKKDEINIKRVQKLANQTYKYGGQADNAIATQNLISKPEEKEVIEQDLIRKLNKNRKKKAHGKSNS